MKRYELAVIGCGKIWEIGHWPGLKEIPDRVHVRCVYDADEAAARRAADETGAALLDDPDRIFDDGAVDMVCIATPPYARVEYVRKACSAGKHLMLEKPMARTIDQAIDIYNNVRESGVKCFIPFMRACSSPRRELAEKISSGTFGEPLVFVHTNLGMPYTWIPLDHWMHDQSLSGGPIFDYSIHFIEMARAALGAEAEAVLYRGAATTGRVKSDDHAGLTVDYAGGAFGQFTKSWCFPPGCDYGHSADHIVCRDAVIEMGKEVLIHTPGGVSEFKPSRPGGNGRAEAFGNLIAAIENDEPLYASELNGLRTNEILDAMERSGASGGKEPVALHDRDRTA